MKTIYIIDIEYIPTRYSSQWKKWIPEEIQNDGLNCVVIDGPDNKDYETTPGGFFNFYETNLYKSVQGEKLAKLFIENKLNADDVFLFTDAWHPALISLRQMVNLSNMDLKIFGMFHAGSYDPSDILGQTSRNNFLNVELGYLDCLDKAFFATNFSKELMLDNLIISNEKRLELENKMFVTGFPYNFDHLEFKPFSQKENNILFPHRISPEKHIELFRKKDKINDEYLSLDEIAKEYKCSVTLEETNSKSEFHDILTKSKFSVSFADQETWGISVFESLFSGCIPIIPDKLSYLEMYTSEIKYDAYNNDGVEDKTEWPQKVYNTIKRLENKSDEELKEIVDKNINYIKENYCTFNNILRHLH